jgi:hypothetical protein
LNSLEPKTLGKIASALSGVLKLTLKKLTLVRVAAFGRMGSSVALAAGCMNGSYAVSRQ